MTNFVSFHALMTLAKRQSYLLEFVALSGQFNVGKVSHVSVIDGRSMVVSFDRNCGTFEGNMTELT